MIRELLPLLLAGPLACDSGGPPEEASLPTPSAGPEAEHPALREGSADQDRRVELERRRREGIDAERQRTGRQPENQETQTAAKLKETALGFLGENSADGVFRLVDDQSDEVLSLVLLSLQETVYKIEGRGFFSGTNRPSDWRETGYFVLADFHLQSGHPDQRYVLQLWLDEFDPSTISKVRIYQSPEQSGGQWVLQSRFDMARELPTVLP